jgi:CMP-N,N'-diacetyllegionaminic acid synthase
MADCIAIIPARGGSKGIKNKNSKLLAGKPLICWTIEAAMRSDKIQDVFVSTDDSDISDISCSVGAKVIERPRELATDEASSESAIIHALEVVRSDYGYLPQYTAFLQCTSPLINHTEINSAVLMLNQGYSSVFAASEFHGFVWEEREDTLSISNCDSTYRKRRQDRRRQWIEAGSVYAFESQQFLYAKNRFFGKIGIVEIPSSRLLEIDNPCDFEKAKQILTMSPRDELDMKYRKHDKKVA